MDKLKIEVILAALDKITAPLKGINKAGSETAKALKAAKDAAKALNDQQKNIDGFRSTSKALAIHRQDLATAQERCKTLKAAMDTANGGTLAQAKAFKEATATARQLSGEVTELTRKKQTLRTALTGSGIDTQHLASAQRDLKGKISEANAAVDRQSAALTRQNERLKQVAATQRLYQQRMGQANKLSGKGMGMMAGGAGLGAAAAIPVNAYAQAEDAATQLNVAMMGAGGKVSAEFQKVNDLAEKLGNRLPGTTADFQNMMTMLVRQGMPAKAILGGLGEATALLAVQLKMAPTAAAEFASKLQDATRTTDKDMIGLMDTIQRTFYLGVDSSNMLQGFAKLSPALSIIKMEGLEAGKALAPLLVMTDQAGMAGEAAGNAYRKIFQLSMDIKKVGKGNKELSGTGISLDFTNGKGEFGGLQQMYAQLDKLKTVNTAQRLAALKKIFGDDAETLQALTIMIEKGSAGYAETQARMAAQADLQTRVNVQLKTLKNLWDAASGTFTNALVAFGESVSPELHATAEWLGKVAERTQAWAKANPGLSHGLMTLLKWSSMLATGLGVLALGTAGGIKAFAFLAKNLGWVGSVLTWLGGVIRVVGMAMMANPILAIVGLIAGAALLIWANWGTLGPKFWALISKVSGYLTGLKDAALSAGHALVDGIVSGIASRWQALKSTVMNTAGAVAGWFKEKLGIHSPSKVFAQLGDFTMQGLAQGITGGQDDPLNAVMGVARKLTTAGAVAIGGALSAGPAAAGGAAGPGGNHIEIHIHAAAGQDAEAIARAVGAELDRRLSQQAARKRSSLRDAD